MREIIGTTIGIVSSVAKCVTITKCAQDFHTTRIVSSTATILVTIFGPKKRKKSVTIFAPKIFFYTLGQNLITHYFEFLQFFPSLRFYNFLRFSRSFNFCDYLICAIVRFFCDLTITRFLRFCNFCDFCNFSIF